MTAGSTEPSSLRRGNPQTREQLLAAAIRVLERKSYAEANVEDFVQEAGVARGTFYIYFRDKSDLLEVLSRRLNDELFDQSHLALDRNLGTFERLRLSLRRVIAAWEQHRGVFRATTELALTRPEFLRLNQEMRMPFIRQIRADLERSIASGHARPIDPAVAAKALAAMMDWFCLLWFGLDEPPYPGADRDPDHVAEQLALLWYRAIYGNDPPEHAARPPAG